MCIRDSMYKGFFKDDKPSLYGQIVSVKNLNDFFESDFSNITSVVVQKFIQDNDYCDIFQMNISENVLEGKASHNFIENKEHVTTSSFPSNSNLLYDIRHYL